MSDVIIRPHCTGDLGWVVSRQALLYAREYGWSIAFEALLCDIAAAFIRDFDPASDRAFIAERDDAVLGAAFVVRADARTAKLRMVYVEPAARGLGLGRRLVGDAIDFARAAGYARMVLWTNDILTAARAIYQGAGFRLIATEPHHSFGKDLVGEEWELDLLA